MPNFLNFKLRSVNNQFCCQLIACFGWAVQDGAKSDSLRQSAFDYAAGVFMEKYG